MKEFWKDYAKLCKDSGKFYKDHWKGIILMNVAIIAVEYAWLSRDSIRDSVKEKFHKEEAQA